MAKITKKDVSHIASLARIKLDEKDIAKYEKELSAILEFVSELKKVNTENVEPLNQATGLKNVLREDKISCEPSPEILLKNAPDKSGTSFRVSKVINKE